MHLARNFCMWQVILLLIGCGLDRPYLPVHCNWDLILALLQTPCINNMQWQQESICLLWFHQIHVFFSKCSDIRCALLLTSSPVFPSSQPCWGEIIGNVSAVHYLIHNYTQAQPEAWESLGGWCQYFHLWIVRVRFHVTLCVWSSANVLDNTHRLHDTVELDTVW